jgi:amino acid efflux transporter
MSKSAVVTKPFRKVLSLPQIVALYIGSVLGSGILLIPGLAAEMAGPASVIAWFAMSILVIPLAITMGLLSAIHPNAGGVSHFVRLAFGDRYADMVGWFFLLSPPIGAPILAITGAKYIAVLFHWGDFQVFIIAALILISVIVMNIFGLQVAGKVQTIVVSLIVAVLIVAVAASVPHFSAANFTPAVPNGWLSVVQSAGLLFWCFIGWEAVTHLSEEFIDPEKNAIRGVLWSVGVVALLYFAVAFMTVATHSYGGGKSEASLSIMVQLSFGPAGGWIVAVTALFLCIATANAYVGAAARTAYALAQKGAAPKWFGKLHNTYHTPIGGLGFITVCFVVVLAVLYSGIIDLTQLIQLPNATFFATYIGGCIAGTRLLRGNRLGRASSWISLIITLGLYPFIGWVALYPLIIVFALLLWRRQNFKGVEEQRRESGF